MTHRNTPKRLQMTAAPLILASRHKCNDSSIWTNKKLQNTSTPLNLGTDAPCVHTLRYTKKCFKNKLTPKPIVMTVTLRYNICWNHTWLYPLLSFIGSAAKIGYFVTKSPAIYYLQGKIELLITCVFMHVLWLGSLVQWFFVTILTQFPWYTVIFSHSGWPKFGLPPPPPPHWGWLRRMRCLDRRAQ